MKKLAFYLAIILLAGCTSNSSLTGSFGSRKYTKGVFWDRPDKIEAKPEVKSKNEVQIKSGSIRAYNKLSNIATNSIMLTKTLRLTNSNKIINNQNIKTIINIKKVATTANIKEDTKPPKDKKDRDLSKPFILAFFAIVLLLIVLSSLQIQIGILLVYLIVLGIILLGLGIYFLAKAESKENPETSQNVTNYGGNSLLFAILGLLTLIILTYLISWLEFGGGLTIFVLLLLVIPLILDILGLHYGKAALKSSTEKNRGQGIAGIIVSGISLLLLVLLVKSIFFP